MDYATLPLADVKAGLEDVAREAQSSFGGLDSRQLNWRPDAARWSVAQCFEHLLTANRLMLTNADAVLGGGAARTIWQRVPMLPGVLGRMLIRSQAPANARRFKTSAAATPTSSDIADDVVPRFVEQHRDAVVRLQTLDEGVAARTIMTSPFIGIVTYSVLDGWRLIYAHDRRHVQQARRVTEMPGFPG